MAVYFASLSCSHSIFLSFFSPVCQLFFPSSLPLLLTFSSFLSNLHTAVYISLSFSLSFQPSRVCSGSCVGLTERDDLVVERMSLHAVIEHYFSSDAFLFYLSLLRITYIQVNLHNRTTLLASLGSVCLPLLCCVFNLVRPF